MKYSLVVLLVAGSLIAVIYSPLFELEEIQVQGLEKVGEGEVLSALDLEPDANLLLLDPDRLRGRLRELAWVRDCRIRRSLPSGLMIEIIEERPLLYIKYGGHKYVVSEGGDVIERWEGNPQKLPVLSGLRLELDEGNRWKLTERGIMLVSILAGLPQKIRDTISEISYTPEQEFKLYTRQGVTCLLGELAEPEKTFSLYKTIFEETNKKDLDIDRIDLRSLESPVLRERSR